MLWKLLYSIPKLTSLEPQTNHCHEFRIIWLCLQVTKDRRWDEVAFALKLEGNNMKFHTQLQILYALFLYKFELTYFYREPAKAARASGTKADLIGSAKLCWTEFASDRQTSKEMGNLKYFWHFRLCFQFYLLGFGGLSI